jgi:hypothetical protein
VLQAAEMIAQFDPTVMDNIDGDETLKVIHGAGRAPQRIFRKQDDVINLREQRANAQRVQAGMAGMASAASVAKDAVPTAIQARDSGLLGQIAQMMPQGGQDAQQ